MCAVRIALDFALFFVCAPARCEVLKVAEHRERDQTFGTNSILIPSLFSVLLFLSFLSPLFASLKVYPSDLKKEEEEGKQRIEGLSLFSTTTKPTSQHCDFSLSF